MALEKVEPKVDFPAQEREVLRFWEDTRAFDKLRALNRGKPGLWMAVFRYLVLTAPFALAGIRIAERLDYPGLYGLIVGLTLAGKATGGVRIQLGGW